ncbi:MAG: hypothetical protein IJ279_06175 [Clostridia bacterium]|nr:hypothetical protein [Clostridia bacterium]
MTNKFNLVSSVILMVIGLLAIGSYIILTINGEIDWRKYLVAAVLSLYFVVTGIREIIKYRRSDKA